MVEQKRIFLGHASEDKPEVKELYQQLKARGFSPWLDAVDLMPGQNWRNEIPKAIKSAGIFLACLSKQSVAKQSYVQREFRYALSAYADLPPDTIYMIPVRLDDCEIPDLRLPELELNLRDLHWVNLFESDGFERLVQSIEHTLGADATEPLPKPQPESPPEEDPPVSGGTEQTTAEIVAPNKVSNPMIKAAWIGAAAVVVAGVFTSPWLAGFLKSSDPTVTPSVMEDVEVTADNIEPAAAPARQPFETFHDCAHELCPAMVMLPAGTFMMGSPAEEERRYDHEGPQHEVTISLPLAIGKTEVTFEDYDRFAEATGREKPDDQGWGRGKRPVINVSWDAAAAYCSWLGKGYRLPTEAEWEYAARADTTTPFSFGETITPDQVNYNGDNPYSDSPIGLYRRKTVEVGGLPANPWGLHEMHGNVWEWVSDWKGYYSSVAMTDPQGPATGSLRIVRGGSWSDDAWDVRSAHRAAGEPGDGYKTLGFRCVGVQGS